MVLEALGEGGTGSVYLVEHIDLKTRHAIKVLLPHLSRHHLPAAGSITLPVPADAGVALPRSAARATAKRVHSPATSFRLPTSGSMIRPSSVGQTPLHLELRVGTHRIRLANKRLGKERIVPVTITRKL